MTREDESPTAPEAPRKGEAASSREARSRAALRENLLRRKARARALDASAPPQDDKDT